MESLLLQSSNKKDIEILATLAKMIGLKTRSISDEELEDMGLANAMKKGRTGEYVDTKKYLDKLRGK
ncbi:MAG: hypothetical protein ABI723_20220 [Bacteroidia bacterium]